MVYIYKNLKGSYFYHFLTLKTFQPFSTSKRRSSVSSQKWAQRTQEVVFGSGTGHCKNPATNLLPSSCLLPCTVMPWPNWGKQAETAGCQRFRHWVVIFHHFLVAAWRRIAASWPPGPYQPASTLTWQFLIHAGTSIKCSTGWILLSVWY